MFAFLKAVVLGAIFAFIVAGLIGHGGGTGGVLHVRHVTLDSFRFYWSWLLFVLGTGLAFLIFVLME